MTKMRIPVSDLVEGDQVLHLDGYVMYTVVSTQTIPFNGFAANVTFRRGIEGMKFWASPDVEVTVDRPDEEE